LGRADGLRREDDSNCETPASEEAARGGVENRAGAAYNLVEQAFIAK